MTVGNATGAYTLICDLDANKDQAIQSCSARHTFASRLVMAGVDLRTVQELMGHKQICMTVRYAHLSPDHTLAAVQRLDQAKPPVTPPVATQLKPPTDTTTDTGAVVLVAAGTVDVRQLAV